MPRFFFNVRQDGVLQEDSEGAELSTPEAAYQEAVLAAREILAEQVAKGEVIDGQRFEITDEKGTVVREVLFRSVIRLE